MKGNPAEPKCGFSRQMVALLQEAGLAFGHFDILEDQQVRYELKKFSNWPTYPQLYHQGKLIGGLGTILTKINTLLLYIIHILTRTL